MEQNDDLLQRITKVEDEITSLKVDVATIKAQVTNHIPHLLNEHINILKSLDERLKPMETIHIKTVGISQVLSIILKVTISLAIFSWTVMQIIYFLIEHTHLINL